MSYKVFVSHANANQALARSVAKAVEEVFPAQVEPWLAVEELGGGVIWKEELKRELRQSDAVICIVTPESVRKQWLYVEWSPFWIDGKKFYVLISSQVQASELVEPMRDSQLVEIHDAECIRKFLNELRKDAGLPESHPVPLERIPAFLAEFEAATRVDFARSYAGFAEESARLPDDDLTQRRILEHLYAEGDAERFCGVFRKVAKAEVKADVMIWLLKKNELELTGRVAGDVGAADHLQRVASAMIRDHGDCPELRHILETIGGLNNTDLRKLAVELAGRGEENGEIFRFIVGTMVSMVELRKIGVHLVQSGKDEQPVFHELVERFRNGNRAELRHVALALVEKRAQRGPQFDHVMEILITKGPPQAVIVLEELEKRDPEMLPLLHHRYQPLVEPDNSAIEWLRKRLGLEAPG